MCQSHAGPFRRGGARKRGSSVCMGLHRLAWVLGRSWVLTGWGHVVYLLRIVFGADHFRVEVACSIDTTTKLQPFSRKSSGRQGSCVDNPSEMRFRGGSLGFLWVSFGTPYPFQ